MVLNLIVREMRVSSERCIIRLRDERRSIIL